MAQQNYRLSIKLGSLSEYCFSIQHSLCTIIIVVSPVIFFNHFIHCPIGRSSLERCAEEEDVDEDQAEGEAAEETGILRMITWDDQ